MKELSQRQYAHLKDLETDLNNSIRHYKETLEDGDEIDSLVSEIMTVIDNLPLIPKGEICADDRLWRFVPRGNANGLKVRYGTIVKVIRIIHPEATSLDVGPMVLVRFVNTDCHEALVYMDELEEA